MAWRVAAASIDGILITEHFGRTRWFYVVDIQRDGQVLPVERRDVAPLCHGGGHSEAGMDEIVAVIRDCVAVLAAKIGPPARKQLEREGIAAFEEPAIAEEAYKKLAAYYVRARIPENV
jgi:predicted Fe-Mo cluster-binding NifX family protein